MLLLLLLLVNNIYFSAGIKIANSQVYIHYCTFRDIFSEYHAAVLELENTYSFTANSIEAFNCTSTESVK